VHHPLLALPYPKPGPDTVKPTDPQSLPRAGKRRAFQTALNVTANTSKEYVQNFCIAAMRRFQSALNTIPVIPPGTPSGRSDTSERTGSNLIWIMSRKVNPA